MEEYAVDVDLEIARLSLEIEDTQRDMKVSLWVMSAAMIAIFTFAPRYLGTPEIVTLSAAVMVIAGLKEHLYRNRINQARSEMQIFKLLIASELNRGRHTARILRFVSDLSPPEKVD